MIPEWRTEADLRQRSPSHQSHGSFFLVGGASGKAMVAATGASRPARESRGQYDATINSSMTG